MLVAVLWDEKDRSVLSQKVLPLYKAFQHEIGVFVLCSNDKVGTETEI